MMTTTRLAPATSRFAALHEHSRRALADEPPAEPKPAAKATGPAKPVGGTVAALQARDRGTGGPSLAAATPTPTPTAAASPQPTAEQRRAAADAVWAKALAKLPGAGRR